MRIKIDHPLQNIACLRETLDKWLKFNTDDTTWRTLEVALTNVNRAKLGLDPVDKVYVTKSEIEDDKESAKFQSKEDSGLGVWITTDLSMDYLHICRPNYSKGIFNSVELTSFIWHHLMAF